MNVVWETDKAATNWHQHRIRFADAQTALDDPAGVGYEDNDHPEQRFARIGYNALGRLLFVVYAYRDADTIRLISARRADRNDRKRYEHR